MSCFPSMFYKLSTHQTDLYLDMTAGWALVLAEPILACLLAEMWI